MTGFALYRLPYEKEVTLVAQAEDEPLELPSYEALNGQTGFVVAPFSISDTCPLVLIRPDIIQAYPSYRECVLERNDLSLAEKRRLSIAIPIPMTLSVSLQVCPTDVSVSWC